MKTAAGGESARAGGRRGTSSPPGRSRVAHGRRCLKTGFKRVGRSALGPVWGVFTTHLLEEHKPWQNDSLASMLIRREKPLNQSIVLPRGPAPQRERPGDGPWGTAVRTHPARERSPCRRSPLRGAKHPALKPSPWGQGSYENRNAPTPVGAHSVGEASGPETFALGTGLLRKPQRPDPCRSPLRGRSIRP
jgi:hypothetical protein